MIFWIYSDKRYILLKNISPLIFKHGICLCIYFWLHCAFVAMFALSLVGANGGYSW